MDIGSVFILVLIGIVVVGFIVFMYGVNAGLWARRAITGKDETAVDARPTHRGPVAEQEEAEASTTFHDREQVHREEARR